MELGLLLVKTIASMFLMMGIGYLIIKTKLLKPEQGKVISTLVLYVIVPCMIITSFQMDFSSQKLTGLLIAAAGAAFVHVIFISLGLILRKPLKLTNVECASAIYPNAVNLIYPLIIAVLGREWTFYCAGYMIIQTFLLWTHAKSIVCAERIFDWKKIVLNTNVLALMLGLALFFGRITLPSIVGNTLESMSGALAPLTMLSIGMLLGEKSFKGILTDKRAYLICLLRLIIFPLAVVLVIGLTNVEKLHPDGWNIMLITVMSASSAVASTIAQFAQMFDKDAAHAGVINVMSVLFCIVTLPLMVTIYQLLT